MKKLTFLKTMFLAVVLMVGSLSAFAQTTVTYSFSSSNEAGLNQAKPGIAVDENIGFASFKNSGTSNPVVLNGQLRLYQNAETGGSIKIYANNGVTITQVIVHASDRTGPAAYTVDGGTETKLDKNTIYTMSGLSATDVVEFYQKDAAKANRIYVDKFEVTYTTSSSTEPTLTASPTSLDFGEVNIGETAEKEITVTGLNLTTAPTHTVSGTGFTVAGELTADGGTLTVTYAPTAEGASTGTLTITGDEQTATVDLSGTGVTPPLAAPVANDVTDKTGTSFIASWNAVEGATSYNVYVYTKAEGSDVVASDLFISEYVEGSSFNKYIEIYNGTGETVDLSNYSLKKETNGAGGYTNKLTLEGNLENGKTYVIAHEQATIFTGANLSTTSQVINFNGDDAVALFKGEVQIDEVGILGGGKGIKWGEDLTLVRKSTVTSPNATFDLNDWDELGKDEHQLGSHTMGSAPAPAPRQKAARPYRVNAATDEQITGSPFNTTETSYEVTGLDKSQAYYYSVTAVRGEEESAYSNEVGPISLVATGLSKATLTDAAAWTANGKVMLNATAGEVIEVYNVAGQKVVSRLATDGLNEVAVQLRGVAIVKVGNRISKVVL